MIHRGYNVRFIGQRGYAMLGIIAALGVAATTVVVTSLSTTAVRNEQGRKDSNALAVAKQALIANAASSNSRPGSLPCPDVNDDGLSDYAVANDPSTPCSQVIGRLPWLTLGLTDLRDAAGERLWYAVSPNFQDLTPNRINASTVGQLTVHESDQATSGVVAFVAAPGKAVGNQQRDQGRINNYEHYLESYAEGTFALNVLPHDTTHNDQLSIITPADIFALVQRRVVKEIQVSLQNYYIAATPNSLPYPGQNEVLHEGTYTYPMTVVSPPFSPAVIAGRLPTNDANLALPAWFNVNEWHRVLFYSVDGNCVNSGVVAAPGTCGSAVFSTPSNSVYIAGTTSTMAMLNFNGVSTVYSNAGSTILAASIQVLTQAQLTAQ
jgi:hypothetical protein